MNSGAFAMIWNDFLHLNMVLMSQKGIDDR